MQSLDLVLSLFFGEIWRVVSVPSIIVAIIASFTLMSVRSALPDFISRIRKFTGFGVSAELDPSVLAKKLLVSAGIKTKGKNELTTKKLSYADVAAEMDINLIHFLLKRDGKKYDFEKLLIEFGKEVGKSKSDNELALMQTAAGYLRGFLSNTANEINPFKNVPGEPDVLLILINQELKNLFAERITS